MENTTLGFEQILNATVRMVRTTWKANICLFMQTDDHGDLHVRAADGIAWETAKTLVIKPGISAMADCLSKNKIILVDSSEAPAAVTALIQPATKKGEKYILSPVAGETRVLGMLMMGPFAKMENLDAREAELRAAGALCAVLSAHWRMYEWISGFVPQLNHELRTPLTAVQGSIGMLLGGMFGQVGSDVKEMLEMAQKGCERTVRAVEDYIVHQTPPTDQKTPDDLK